MVKKTIATIFVLLNEENNPAAKFYPKSGLKLKMSGANFGMLLTEIIKVQCEDQDADQAGHIGYFAKAYVVFTGVRCHNKTDLK